MCVDAVSWNNNISRAACVCCCLACGERCSLSPPPPLLPCSSLPACRCRSSVHAVSFCCGHDSVQHHGMSWQPSRRRYFLSPRHSRIIFLLLLFYSITHLLPISTLYTFFCSLFVASVSDIFVQHDHQTFPECFLFLHKLRKIQFLVDFDLDNDIIAPLLITLCQSNCTNAP